MPMLKFPVRDAGPWRIAQPPNRTRETRLSGMTTGAPGNVTHGGTVNPPANRKGRAGNPPPKGARAWDLPKQHRWVNLSVITADKAVIQRVQVPPRQMLDRTSSDATT